MDNIGYSKKLDHMQEKMNQLFPDRDERKKLKVLDIAAGTGLGGKRLFELGFTYIDGVGKSHRITNPYQVLMGHQSP